MLIYFSHWWGEDAPAIENQLEICEFSERILVRCFFVSAKKNLDESQNFFFLFLDNIWQVFLFYIIFVLKKNFFHLIFIFQKNNFSVVFPLEKFFCCNLQVLFSWIILFLFSFVGTRQSEKQFLTSNRECFLIPTYIFEFLGNISGILKIRELLKTHIWPFSKNISSDFRR